MVDSGSEYKDPDPPPLQVLWFAERPDVPEVTYRERRAVWPDGSEFCFEVSPEEAQVVSQRRKAWLWRNRRETSREDPEL
ncbi:hypothetical protein AOZ06_46025 [Kibdelosporangium phytohabitans]|uniref:Uncharacterized protein n=1 Tax=Kibdelosporangium phytohabitans TaxID=860235 RepID=A0A0N7F550_9PSEU|nr:hypothetical protein AOZ06_46025 [Kibdelosporangium phytohabitans]